MAFLKWSPTLSVNVLKFDAQHQTLVRMLNELHTAMLEGRGKDAVGTTLDGLVRYTETHFADEEQLMAKHAFPGLGSHSAEHRKLIEQVQQLQEQHRSGRSALSVDVLAFLKDWLVHHIQGTDKQYGAYFQTKGVV
jgi:hemerythrin-like metal-binding protein